MVFKLVRTDTVEPCKIQLSTGTHLLGRGKLLVCDDKRVSRNHGEINVTEDSLTIKSLHQNPFFYMKKGLDDVEILRQNCTVELSNGDKFGLLPDSYWYEILHFVLTGINELGENLDHEREIMNEQNKPVNTNNEKYDDNTESMDNTCDKIEVNDNRNEDGLNISSSDKNSQEVLNLELNETIGDRPESPSVLKNEQAEAQDESKETNSPTQQTQSSLKRCYSSDISDDEVKKVKTEPGLIQQEDIKQEQDENDAKPGHSNDQNSSKADDKDGRLSSPVRRPRERCIYGDKCYRRNPVHKAEFSHPSDGDWGAGERGACPWGSACRRRDPRHWALHDHPPGTSPPPPHQHQHQDRPGTKKRNRSPTVTPVDDNLPAKRTRKPIKQPDWGSLGLDDEDEEDPYNTDSSDEWQPGIEDTVNTQSQDFDFPEVSTQDLSD